MNRLLAVNIWTMNEVDKLVHSIAKRKYPETEQDKKCIDKWGKLVIKRGHFSKAVINFISKYDNEGTETILDSGAKQTNPGHQTIQSEDSGQPAD